MKFRPQILALALLAACGGTHQNSEISSLEFKSYKFSAITLLVHPEALDRELSDIRAKIDHANVFTSAFHMLDEFLWQLAELSGHRAQNQSMLEILQSLGLNTRTEVSAQLFSPNAPAAGQLLKSFLSSQPTEITKEIAWQLHLKLPLDFTQPLRLPHVLTELARSQGFEARCESAEQTTCPHYHREKDLWLFLNAQPAEIILDLVSPLQKGTQPQPSSPPPLPKSDAPLQITLSPAGFAALEVALDASRILKSPQSMNLEEIQAYRDAYTELLVECSAQFSEVAKKAHSLIFRLESPKTLTLKALLSESAENDWRSVLGMHISSAQTWPLSMSLALSQPTGNTKFSDWSQFSRCTAGHTLAAYLFAWPLLPHFKELQWFQAVAPFGAKQLKTDGTFLALNPPTQIRAVMLPEVPENTEEILTEQQSTSHLEKFSLQPHPQGALFFSARDSELPKLEVKEFSNKSTEFFSLHVEPHALQAAIPLPVPALMTLSSLAQQIEAHGTLQNSELTLTLTLQ